MDIMLGERGTHCKRGVGLLRILELARSEFIPLSHPIHAEISTDNESHQKDNSAPVDGKHVLEAASLG